MFLGQRYNIIVKADQADVAENFWMRAIPQIACSDNDNADNIKGIGFYGDNAANPATTGYEYTDGWVDGDVINLVPLFSKTVESPTMSSPKDVTFGKNTDNLFRCKSNFFDGVQLDVDQYPGRLKAQELKTDFIPGWGSFLVPLRYRRCDETTKECVVR